jgi:hypothetical protein
VPEVGGRGLGVVAEKRDPRFDRAAARFAARVITERRLRPLEAHPVLALAQGLPQAQETTGTALTTLASAAGHAADAADRGPLPSAAEQTARPVFSFALGALALLPLRAEPVTPPATGLLLLGHGGLQPVVAAHFTLRPPPGDCQPRR